MNGDIPPEMMNKLQARHAAKVLSNWWKLPDTIIEKYSDGWLNAEEALGYPNWWLTAVDYQNGPPPPPSELGSVPHIVDSKCSDSHVRSCLDTCPAEGLAACAKHCAGNCAESVKKSDIHQLSRWTHEDGAVKPACNAIQVQSYICVMHLK